MKQIPLKTVEVVMNDRPTRLSYQAQIIELMKAPTGNKGADLDEIRRSIRVMDAVDSANGGLLELEDADFEYMAHKIKSARWPIIDKYVLQFIEDVTGVE